MKLKNIIIKLRKMYYFNSKLYIDELERNRENVNIETINNR